MKRVLATVSVLAIAALLRFWNLANPDVLVFDEVYYVRDAYSQLVNGFATEWPDNEKTFNSQIAKTMLADPAYVAHPPLVKWMIAIGMILFGVDSGWGWRFATAFAGMLTVAVTMLLAWKMTRVFWVAQVSAILLAVEGIHVTLSRVSLLDGHLALLVAVGALCVWQDHEWVRRR